MAGNRQVDFILYCIKSDMTLRFTIAFLIVITTYLPIASCTTPAIDVYRPSNDECGKRIPEEGHGTCMDCMVSFIGKLQEDTYVIEWERNNQDGNNDVISHNDLIAEFFSPRFAVKVIYDTHEKYGGDYEIYRLWISNATRGDTNTYTCRFEYTLDGFKSSVKKSLDLTVRYFPSNSYPLCNGGNEFLLGGDVVFKCLSEVGEPQVHLNWTYNIKIGNEFITQVAPGNTVPQNGGTILETLYTTAIESFDGSTFVCTLSSDFFPDKSRSCSIGPLKIFNIPTEPPGPPTLLTTIQSSPSTPVTSQLETTVSTTQKEPTTNSVTSRAPPVSEHDLTTNSYLTTDALTTDISDITISPSTSLIANSFQTTTSKPVVHTTPESAIKETTQSSATFTTRSLTSKYSIFTTVNQNPENSFSTVTRRTTNEPMTKFSDQTVPGNTTSGTNGGAKSGSLNTWALIIGLSCAIIIFAILLLFVFCRWRQTKEKLKKHGESAHLPAMNYNDLQHKYDSNGHAAYFQEVTDEIPTYPPGKQLEGQRLRVGPGVMYGANMAATYPYNERLYHQAPTLQVRGTYPRATPNGMPSAPNGVHANLNGHTYSELTPPKLPPNRPMSMPPCTNPMYDHSLRDPYYYKIQAPSAPALETVEPSQQGIVASILYQSTSDTSIMQPYVEINRNGGTHKANEEIYQTLS